MAEYSIAECSYSVVAYKSKVALHFKTNQTQKTTVTTNGRKCIRVENVKPRQGGHDFLQPGHVFFSQHSYPRIVVTISSDCCCCDRRNNQFIQRTASNTPLNSQSVNSRIHIILLNRYTLIIIRVGCT